MKGSFLWERIKEFPALKWLGAFILLKEGAELIEEALLAAIRDRIALFKLPKKIVFVEDFLRNSAGKILNKEMKEGLS